MSYRKIISVVNAHTASTVVARYAIALADSCKAELVLYAAHEEGSGDTMLRHIDLHLGHLYAAASELGIPVTRTTEIGKFSELLPVRVQAEEADLVFYPLTPYERYAATLQRHTVHRLLRTLRSDLAIMRTITMAKPHPRHILVPLGRVIRDKERRLLFIAELAKSFHSQVTLLHLAAERDARGIPDDVSLFRTRLEGQYVMVQERVARGQIGKSIAVEAVTRQHDLVVLGASGRGVLRRLLLGNPAGDILQQPPCNTILFQAAH